MMYSSYRPSTREKHQAEAARYVGSRRPWMRSYIAWRRRVSASPMLLCIAWRALGAVISG